MANNLFQIKRTTVSGRVPTTTNLNTGELAINLTDRIMYSSDGTEVFEIGANSTNIEVSGNATINAIIANGSIGTPGQVLTTDGTKIYWASVAGNIQFVNQHFLGDGTTTTYTITGGYTPGSLSVFLNGVRCGADDCNTTSGTQIVFFKAPVESLEIDVAGMLLGVTLVPQKELKIVEPPPKKEIQPPAPKYRKKRSVKKNDR